MNNMGPTAQILTRAGWSTDMDFVGHRKAVTCVVCSNFTFCVLQTHDICITIYLLEDNLGSIEKRECVGSVQDVCVASM